MIKTRLFLPVLVLTALAAIAVAGCGSSSDSSSSDAASFAKPGSLVYVEGTLQPTGALQSNVDSIAKAVAGVDNLGNYVVSKLEDSAKDDGEPFDFTKEVEPWLGERAGVAFQELDEEGDPSDPVIAIASTDVDATQEFVDSQAENDDDPYQDASYEGVDFKVGGSEGNAIGVVGDYLLIAEGEPAFKKAIDASEDGDSLADEARFEDAWSAASEGSLADAYIDVGGLIKESGDEIGSQAREILGNAGIDPSEATAVASLLPGADQVEIDFSSELGGEQAPSGDASKLLGALPGDSFAAVAVTGFGNQLEEAIDSLDASGIPDQVPPNKLKSGLKAFGIDLEKLIPAFEDAGVFAVGDRESNLGGALVVTTGGSEEVTKTVTKIGIFLRSTGTPGITAVKGKASGFSIRSPELGPKPLVIATQGERLAIGYGLAPTLQGLATEAETLSDSPAYKEAVSALGSTPISGFVDGPAALGLAEALVPRSETGFQEAKRYLKAIDFIGIGSGTEDELATAKLIVGVGE